MMAISGSRFIVLGKGKFKKVCLETKIQFNGEVLMNTIIITNNEASFYIEKIYDLMGDSLKQEYEILPQTVNFNFDPDLIVSAPEAIYAMILIIKLGYDVIKKKIKDKSDTGLCDITSIEVDNTQNIYNIKTNLNNVKIKIKHTDNCTELSVQEIHE
ncbi:MAG: hypothetical protein U0L59_08470 [Faecalimonas sp.]|nr:hypothetical protein [Faecalimonas sp.]